jgi:hypothetical protein
MAVILNASTSSGFVQSADTSGVVQIQSNGSTVLTVDSSGVTATSISGTIVIGTQASASGTAVDFTGIPSWAKSITVMLNGVSLTGTDRVWLQLGDSGGFETTGYVSAASDNNSDAVSTSSFVLTGTTLAAATYTGAVRLVLSTSNTWFVMGDIGSSSYGSSAVSGSKTLSDVLTQIRITRSGTNTFDAGTINLQYEG